MSANLCCVTRTHSKFSNDEIAKWSEVSEFYKTDAGGQKPTAERTSNPAAGFTDVDLLETVNRIETKIDIVSW